MYPIYVIFHVITVFTHAKKINWTLKISKLYLCFSVVAPDMGGKHFR